MIKYHVLDEHTLGYIDDRSPNYLGVLGSKITRGGHSWLNSPFWISPHSPHTLRPATQADFDYFMVSSTGHNLTLRN